MPFASTYSALSARGVSSVDNNYGVVQTINGVANNTQFGQDISMSFTGSYAVIGAGAESVIPGAGGSRGVIRFYAKDLNNKYQSSGSFTGPNVPNLNFSLGHSLSMSGNAEWTVAGVVPSATRIGYAQIFSRSGNTFTLDTTLYAPSNVAGTRFGDCVAVSNSGNYIAVSEQTNGFIRIYNRSPNWGIHSNIANIPAGVIGDIDLDEDANICIVGAYTALDPGYIYVYTRNNTTWTLSQTLTTSDGVNGDLFGISLCINTHGNFIVGSAPEADIGNISGAGALYTFTSANGVWTETNKIITQDPSATARLADSRNIGITNSGNKIIAGCRNLSAAYVFFNIGNTYAEIQKINGIANSAFGFALATTDSANITLIGDPFANTFTGATYNYNL